MNNSKQPVSYFTKQNSIKRRLFPELVSLKESNSSPLLSPFINNTNKLYYFQKNDFLFGFLNLINLSSYNSLWLSSVYSISIYINYKKNV